MKRTSWLSILGMVGLVGCDGCNLPDVVEEGGGGTGGASVSSTGGSGGGDATLCDGAEIDLTADPEHCGACDRSCRGQACVASECVAEPLFETFGETIQAGFITEVLPTDDYVYLGVLGGDLVTGGVVRVDTVQWKLDLDWLVGVDRPPTSLVWLQDANGGRVVVSDSVGLYAIPATAQAPIALASHHLPGTTGADGTYHLSASGLHLVRANHDDGVIETFFHTGGVAIAPLMTPSTQSVWSVAATPTATYWTSRGAGGGVYREGNPVQTGGTPTGLTETDGFVYWARCDAGEIWRQQVGSGASPEQVSGSRPEPFFIVADLTYVYWIELAQPQCGATLVEQWAATWGTRSARLVRARTDGTGEPLVLKSGIPGPRSLALHGDHVYYSSLSEGIPRQKRPAQSRLNRIAR